MLRQQNGSDDCNRRCRALAATVLGRQGGKSNRTGAIDISGLSMVGMESVEFVVEASCWVVLEGALGESVGHTLSRAIIAAINGHETKSSFFFQEIPSTPGCFDNHTTNFDPRGATNSPATVAMVQCANLVGCIAFYHPDGTTSLPTFPMIVHGEPPQALDGKVHVYSRNHRMAKGLQAQKNLPSKH
jgi:hypothetical protein